jgi:hypothetical protein
MHQKYILLVRWIGFDFVENPLPTLLDHKDIGFDAWDNIQFADNSFASCNEE